MLVWPTVVEFPLHGWPAPGLWGCDEAAHHWGRDVTKEGCPLMTREREAPTVRLLGLSGSIELGFGGGVNACANLQGG